ncbi:MAG: GAF domain-containing protein [Bacteroidales bacterium]
MQYNSYKYILYATLVVVTLVSFFLANLLIGLISANTATTGAIVVVILNLVINFLLFYLLFQLLQALSDKERLITQLSDELNRLKAPQEEEEKIETVTFNPAEVAQSIIPSTPQNLSLEAFCDKILIGIAQHCQVVTGIFYVKSPGTNSYLPTAKYAYYSAEQVEPVTEGEGLVGQVIKDKKPVSINQVPANYLRVVSGLGQSSPRYLYIFPILNKEEVIASVELAAFVPFDDNQKQILEHLANVVGKIIVKLKQ